MKTGISILVLVALVVGPMAVGPAWAQPAGEANDYVSRAEYEKLKRGFETLQAQMAEMKQQQRTGTADQDTQEYLEFLSEEVDRITEQVSTFRTGTTDFLITGYALAGYANSEEGNASFDAAFFPIFLWKLSDQVSFVSELEVELDGDATAVNLEFMEIDIELNDYLTLRGGKFLTPLSTFKEQLHPAWINKLPDQPLFASGGARLIPTSSLGFQLSGAAAVGSAKVTYAGWISNGPKLVTSGSKTGQLNFSNFSDVNEGKALGGRVSVFLIPELELAYAVLWGEVGPAGGNFNNVDAIIHDFSLGYIRESDLLGGRIDVRFEYVRSEVDDAAFATAVIPDNTREGGFAQIAYRPTHQSGFLKDLEGVFRWDFIDNPSDATGTTKSFEENRYTLGINYWVNPSTVLKVAYQIDDVDDPQGVQKDSDALLLQAAMGF